MQIAHGCNSVVATRMALKLSDYVITEAGFGADLGAENSSISCRFAGLVPTQLLLWLLFVPEVARGADKKELDVENLQAPRRSTNLLQHVENITDVFGLPAVVAINRFPADTEAELKLVEDSCRKLGVNVALSEVWGKGGEGGIELAEEVIRLCEAENNFTFCYDTESSIADKIKDICRKVYRAEGVEILSSARRQIRRLEKLGFGNLPVCMAKTQYSFSDDAKLLGSPRNFKVTVRDIKLSAGAGFIVALTGEIMTMPGLPKVPAAESIDVDKTGRISGLF